MTHIVTSFAGYDNEDYIFPAHKPHDISNNIYLKSNTAKNTVSIGLFKVNLLRNCVRMKMGFFKKRTKGDTE